MARVEQAPEKACHLSLLRRTERGSSGCRLWKYRYSPFKYFKYNHFIWTLVAHTDTCLSHGVCDGPKMSALLTV